MNNNLIELDQRFCFGKKPILTPTKGTWIAGGAIRQWFAGKENISDVDVFGDSRESLDNFIKTQLVGSKKLVENDNLRSYSHQNQLIQIIEVDYYPNIETCLDSFDFNVCQFAWDGEKIFTTVSSIVSVLRGHLAVHKISQNLAADSLRRAFKYAKKGYEPCNLTLLEIAKSFIGLTEEMVKDQVVISPGGGQRFLGID